MCFKSLDDSIDASSLVEVECLESIDHGVIMTGIEEEYFDQLRQAIHLYHRDMSDEHNVYSWPI
jgi:hypothetical protein